MVEYIFLGSGLAFAAAIQPGPFQAFLLSIVSRHGWKRSLPAALAPIVSDWPIAALILFVINRVPDLMSRVLQFAGGLLLLYLAWGSFQSWRKNEVETPSQENQPSTLFQAVMVNLLNPNPYLGWSLVLGPAAISAWKENAVYAVALVVAFYAVLVLGNAIIIVLLGTTTFLGARAQRSLILVSAITLAALGVYRLVDSLFQYFGS